MVLHWQAGSIVSVLPKHLSCKPVARLLETFIKEEGGLELGRINGF